MSNTGRGLQGGMREGEWEEDQVEAIPKLRRGGEAHRLPDRRALIT